MSDVDWPRRAGLSAALDEAAIVAITDRAGRILYCNDKFEAVSGYSREELVGQTHRVVNSGAHTRDYFRDLYRTIAGGQVWRGTIENRTKAGEPYWVDTTIVPNLGSDGRPETYTAIRFEVSDHVRALKALEVAQAEARLAAEARDRFFANISHEVRTPLNAVLGLASALTHTALTPRQNDMLNLITGAGDALRRVLDDMLDLSKMQAGQFTLAPAPFDLRADIGAVVEMRRAGAEAKGLTLAATFSDAANGVVVGDGVRIAQIVSNLVSNAVKRLDLREAVEKKGFGGGVDHGFGLGPDLVRDAKLIEPILGAVVLEAGQGADGRLGLVCEARGEGRDQTIRRHSPERSRVAPVIDDGALLSQR